MGIKRFNVSPPDTRHSTLTLVTGIEAYTDRSRLIGQAALRDNAGLGKLASFRAADLFRF